MELIADNHDLIEYLTDDNSLLDSVIEKIEIAGESDGFNVHVWLNMRPSASEDKIKICFNHCKNYNFNFSDDHIFYNVERVKLFRTEEGLFYVSFDPLDEEEAVSDDDNDVIQSRRVSAYKL